MNSTGIVVNRRTLLGGIAGAASSIAASAKAAQRQDKPAGPTDRRGRPGPRNLITDVAGIKVGQADDPRVRTGVTVIVPEKESTAAVDVRGGGPGTRETDALNAYNLVHAADAIVLSGGSVYGLAAADGVASWLGARGRGYMAVPTPGVPRSPIVPAAILFDLANGGDKNWGLDPPYRSLGMKAIENASDAFALGTAGAGYGASAGSLKGGTGSASVVTFDEITVGAIV
ncbi:MAG TPA: P1 family peptidase, partial [Sphingomicrobium sp.]|nr:P1 family peptidase [Sphingomicrobium sp.]